MSNIEQLPQWFLSIYIFLVGLCLGSLLNVVISRGLSGEDIVFDRSKCPKCKNQLKWYMNIPLLSYIFLGGKCGFCKEKISIQYPIVELICALGFLFTYLTFGLTLKTLFVCAFLFFFIAISTTDFKETVIIDTHAYIILVLGILYSFLKLGDISIIQAIIGAVVGFIFFEIIANSGKLFCDSRIFGEGDSLIALGLGAIFGWKVLLIIFAISIALQAIFAIPIMAIKTLSQKKYKLLVSYILVFISLLFVLINNYFKFLQEGAIYYLATLVICVSLIWSLANIIKEIKEKSQDDSKVGEEKYTIFPFGPALLISATLCIFYLPQIKSLILNNIFNF